MGFSFFWILVGSVVLPSLVSKEKAKVEPMVMEILKSLPWRASAWQKSRHWVAKEESDSLTAVIFVYFWIIKKDDSTRKWNMFFCVCINDDDDDDDGDDDDDDDDGDDNNDNDDDDDCQWPRWVMTSNSNTSLSASFES